MKHLLLLTLLLPACIEVDTKNEIEFDADGDGVTEFDGDCNDDDATIHMGTPDLCDGLGNNCTYCDR